MKTTQICSNILGSSLDVVFASNDLEGEFNESVKIHVWKITEKKFETCGILIIFSNYLWCVLKANLVSYVLKLTKEKNLTKF